MPDALLLKATRYCSLYVIQCLTVPKHVSVEVLDIVSWYYLLCVYVFTYVLYQGGSDDVSKELI
jgi:hypothetical protein